MGNEQRKSYYERHKVELCKKTLDQYIPQSIKKINVLIPEKINIYYKDFPYEIYGEPVIKKRIIGKYKKIAWSIRSVILRRCKDIYIVFTGVHFVIIHMRSFIYEK